MSCSPSVLTSDGGLLKYEGILTALGHDLAAVLLLNIQHFTTCNTHLSMPRLSCRLLKREGIRTALVPDLAAVPKYNSCQAVQRGLRQSTNEILMVAPTAFGFNHEAAEDNYFMNDTLKGGKGTAPGTEVTNRVLQEFSGLYRELTEVGVAGRGGRGAGKLFLGA